MGNGRIRLDWPETAMKLAFNIAEYRSEDLSTQVGACIIKQDSDIILGYNGSPSGVEIDWQNREEKRKRVIHAESNVLSRVKVGETKIFCVTHLPCLECLKLIAQKKICTVFYKKILDNYSPAEVFKIASEFGIELIQLKDEIKTVNQIQICNYFKYEGFRSPGVPSWAEPLPIPTHVGQKVKVVKGCRSGKVGIVTKHWLNVDDCSGTYGQQLYDLDHENPNNNSFGINVKDCEFIY